MAAMKARARLCTVVLLWVAMVAATASERSSVHSRAFQREQPCPSTGARRGGCPGYVIDHVQPLCAGGADSPQNMQWQTVEDGRRKDAHERRLCRAMKVAGAT